MNRLILFACTLFSCLLFFSYSGGAQCDDDLPTGFITYSGPVCPGSQVTVVFHLTSLDDDEDDDSFDAIYTLNGNEFELQEILDQHSIAITISTNTIITLNTIHESDQDDDCIAEINQSLLLEVFPLPSLALNVINSPTCGQPTGVVELIGNNGSPPYQYSSNGINYQTENTFTSLGAGNYTFWIKDQSDCTNYSELTLNTNSDLQASISDFTHPDCASSNGTITVFAEGGMMPYSYSLDDINYQDEVQFENLPGGTYDIFIRDANNCLVVISHQLTDPAESLIPAEFTLELSDESACLNEEYDIIGNLPPGTLGEWSVTPEEGVFIPDFSSEVSSIEFLAPGTYELQWALSIEGCLNYSTASSIASTAPFPIANDDGPVSTEPGTSTLLYPVDNDIFEPGSTLHILNAPGEGEAFTQDLNIMYTPFSGLTSNVDSLTYMLCALDCPNHCDTASIVIHIEQDGVDPCDLNQELPDSFFPEGLTPNNDGMNDVLEFIIVDPTECPYVYRNSEVVIFNRWGDKVFEAAPYDNNWSGTSPGGKELPPGVYYYVLKVEVLDYRRFGSVTIFR